MEQQRNALEPADKDVAALLDCIERGDTKKQAKAVTKLNTKKIAALTEELLAEEQVLVRYRDDANSLHLTRIGQKILQYLEDEDKMESASLNELAQAYNIVKKNELTANGKPSEIKGLVGILMEIEKEEMENSKSTQVSGSIIDVSEEDQEELPAL